MKKNLVGPMIRYRPASLVKLDMPRIDIVQKSTWQLLQDSKSAGKVGRWGLKEWNSALSGISTDKDSTMRGMHVFKEMKSYGIVPDTGTYHSLVKCCRSQPRFLMVIHEHAYKESVRSEKLLFNNEYLIDLIRYFVEARNPSQVAHLWQDVVTVKLQLSTLTILQFMRAFAIIKDEAKIIKLSEILVARRSNNPWDLDVNHSLMSAYLAVKNYEKVCKLFQFMRIQPTLETFNLVLPAMFALKDFESIHMIGKVMLKSKEFDCSSLLVLISAAGQTQNLKRLADIAELIHYQPDANKLFATLIDAYILCDNDALVAKTLIDYQSHRRTTHKGISTGEMALAFIDNDKTMLSKFREWAPAELPRIVLANVASFYATRRDIQQIGTFFKKYVLRPDILMLHWARRIAKKNLEMSKLVDKCQAEPVNGRPEQINQSLLWAKKQIEAPVSFEVGIDGPFKVVYRAMTDSWVKGLDSVTGTDGFSEEAISMTRFIEEMHSFETELVQSSVISQHLQFSGAGKS